MRDSIAVLLFVLVILAFFGVVGTMTVSVWSECRSSGHSFVYCLYLISGK